MTARKRSTTTARKTARRQKPPVGAEEEAKPVSKLEIYQRINRFDAHARRELRKFMRNAIERMLAAGRGEPLPPKYDYEGNLDKFE